MVTKFPAPVEVGVGVIVCVALSPWEPCHTFTLTNSWYTLVIGAQGGRGNKTTWSERQISLSRGSRDIFSTETGNRSASSRGPGVDGMTMVVGPCPLPACCLFRLLVIGAQGGRGNKTTWSDKQTSLSRGSGVYST